MSLTPIELVGEESGQLFEAARTAPAGQRRLRQLDVQLFQAPYFTIDQANFKVANVANLEDAEKAIAQGHAAAYVGHVRPGVVAVDIDCDDAEVADDLLGELEAFCDDLGLWQLHRQSGGGPGRRHAFIVAGTRHQSVVVRRIQELRDEYGLDARTIDLRQAIRPLSSPHRTGAALASIVTDGLASFPTHLVPQEKRQQRSKRLRAKPFSPSTVKPDKADLLTTAQLATFRIQPHFGDRSETEWRITRRLKRMGASPSAVWNTLVSDERPELGHAMQHGYAWFLHYWWEPEDKVSSEAVQTNSTVQGAWNSQVLAASLALRSVWENFSTRQRHTLEHVLVVAAQRITKNAGKSTPLPLRDLQADTNISLPTLRLSLAALRAEGLLTRTSEYRFSLDAATASDEYELGPVVQDGSVTYTPKLFTPPPAASPLWLSLGSTALSLTISLLHAENSGLLSTSELLRLHTGSPTLSSSQKSHFGNLLAALVERKIVVQDRLSGSWSILCKKRIVQPREGLKLWASLRRRVSEERRSFRQFLEELKVLGTSLWNAQRDAAIEQTRLANRRRQAAWWASLSPAEKARRSEVYRTAWLSYSTEEKEARLALLKSRQPAAEKLERSGFANR